MNTLTLLNAEVVFVNLLEESGFKPSVTIKVTPEFEKQISAFWAENQIGKTGQGVAVFKEYTNKENVTTRQFNVALNPTVKFAGINGLTEKDLGFGAVVNMVINCFTYNNKFSGGKDRQSTNVAACVILRGRKTGNDAVLSELLSITANSTIEVKEDAPAPAKPAADLPF